MLQLFELGQTLSGSARAAGSFANQQAMSTETRISTPRGEEVYGVSGGISYHQSALSAGGGRFSVKELNDGGISVRDENTGTNVSGNANGVWSANIAGLNAQSLKSIQNSSASEVSKAISDTLRSGQTAEATANLAFDKATSHTINAQAGEVFKAASQTAFDKMAASGNVKAQELQAALMGGGKILGIAGGEVNVSNKDGKTITFQFSQKEMEQWTKDFSDNVTSAYSYSDSTRASLNNAFKTFSSHEFGKVHQAMDKYSQVEAFTQSYSADKVPQAINSYIQSGANPEATNAFNNGNYSKAYSIAGKQFENWVNSDPQKLAQYFNAGSFASPANSVGDIPAETNLYNPARANAIHGANNIGTANSNAIKYGDTYEGNKNTMQSSHTSFSGQQTTTPTNDTPKSKTQGEVQGNIDDRQQELKGKPIQRTLSNGINTPSGFEQEFGKFSKNPIKYLGFDNDEKAITNTKSNIPPVPKSPLE